jgi:acyl carrier protein
MATQAVAVEAKIRGYILENLLFSNDPAELPNDESLLERGVIDSTGVLEIILFLEGEFGIEVKASEMLPENFDTVDNMVRFVGRLQGKP